MELASVLKYEEKERERTRLMKLAVKMTLEELRISAARLADHISYYENRDEVDTRTLALWHLREQVATEIIQAMSVGSFKNSSAKKVFTRPLIGGGETLVAEFTGGLKRS